MNVTFKVSPAQAIDLIVESSLSEVRTVSMLIAHALNASSAAPRSDVRLAGFMQLVDVPALESTADLERFRERYQIWVVRNGLRDLVAAMEAFLNSMHTLLVDAQRHLGVFGRQKVRDLVREFERFGVSKKLRAMHRHFGLETNLLAYVDSLTSARNCITHRHGIVGTADCDASGALYLRWLGVDATISEGDGTVHVITPQTLGPFDSSRFSEGDAHLTVGVVSREIRFALGDALVIAPRQLEEISSMVLFVCVKMRQLTLNWLLDSGFNVHGGVRVPEPEASFSLGYESPETSGPRPDLS